MTEYIAKTQRHPAELWARIAEYRHANRIGTEIEAVRRLLELGLSAGSTRPPLQHYLSAEQISQLAMPMINPPHRCSVCNVGYWGDENPWCLSQNCPGGRS